jgi:hypothetical protein
LFDIPCIESYPCWLHVSGVPGGGEKIDGKANLTLMVYMAGDNYIKRLQNALNHFDSSWAKLGHNFFEN